MANSIAIKNAVLQPSCESELKHNHHLLFFFSLFGKMGTKEPATPERFAEASVSAETV